MECAYLVDCEAAHHELPVKAQVAQLRGVAETARELLHGLCVRQVLESLRLVLRH